LRSEAGVFLNRSLPLDAGIRQQSSAVTCRRNQPQAG